MEPTLSAYERERLENIRQNQAALASLGLVDSVLISPFKRKSAAKKVRAAKKVARPSSSRSALLETKAKEAHRRLRIERERAEAQRERAEAQRMARRQAQKEKARAAEVARRLREVEQAGIATLRRAAAAEAHLKRVAAARERAEQAREQRVAAARARATAREEERRQSRDEAGQRSAATRFRAAYRSGRSQRASKRARMALRALQLGTELPLPTTRGLCATPGCSLPDFHFGPCTCHAVGRARVSRQRVAYEDRGSSGEESDSEDYVPVHRRSDEEEPPNSTAGRAARAARRSAIRIVGSVVLGEVTRWLPADEEDGALFRVVHDDGDEEDLEEEELEEARELYSLVQQERAMRTDHAAVGWRVVRTFPRGPVLATVAKWLPPDGEDGALFRVVHDDGDEEDLEEEEYRQALADYRNLLRVGKGEAKRAASVAAESKASPGPPAARATRAAASRGSRG